MYLYRRVRTPQRPLPLYRAIYVVSCVLLGPGSGPVGALAAAVDVSPGVARDAQVYPQAQEFVLKDQYDRTHVYRFPRQTMSVLFFADHAGSGQLTDWIRPLYDRYQQGIGIYGVADLSAVPGLLRGVLSMVFRAQVQYPVMLDWRGIVSRSYHAQSGQANVFVVDTQGHIVLQLVGAVSPERLQRVMAHIDRLMQWQGDATLTHSTRP